MDEDGDDAERAGLQREKEQLVVEINAALRDVVSNMRTLNRNMDSLIDVGQEMENVAEVRWSSRSSHAFGAAARGMRRGAAAVAAEARGSHVAAHRVRCAAHLTTTPAPARRRCGPSSSPRPRQRGPPRGRRRGLVFSHWIARSLASAARAAGCRIAQSRWGS